MGQAIVFGVAASSALVIGGALGAWWRPPRAVVAAALAFASGALVSALAFELFSDAVAVAGLARSGAGLLAGAAAFVAIHAWSERRAPTPRPGEMPGSPGARGVGLALLAAVTLDGVPENAALGVSLVEDASLALLVAIFFSNLPESLVGAVFMREEGHSRRFVVWVWCAAAVLLAAAVVVGRVALDGASGRLVGFVLAFAGGAVLASLADTLMPEAYGEGGSTVALATCAGFFVSFVLAE